MDLGDYLLVTLLNGLLIGGAAGLLSPSIRRVDSSAMFAGATASVLAAITIPMLFPGGAGLGLMMSVVMATVAVVVIAPRLRTTS